jgi:hypothetical protein
MVLGKIVQVNLYIVLIPKPVIMVEKMVLVYTMVPEQIVGAMPCTARIQRHVTMEVKTVPVFIMELTKIVIKINLPAKIQKPVIIMKWGVVILQLQIIIVRAVG